MTTLQELTTKIKSIILNAMKEKHLTPFKLARLADVDITAISNYIKGRTKCMHPENFMKVLNALGLVEEIDNVLSEYYNSN